MKKTTPSISNFDLWLLIGELHHAIVLARQRELSPYNIGAQQLKVLRTIKQLGSQATLSSIAAIVGRKIDVISRQAVRLEKDGLIKRIKDKPKSRRLRIELTEKGLQMLKISNESKYLNMKFAFLTEQERQQMSSILRKMNNTMKEHSPA